LLRQRLLQGRNHKDNADSKHQNRSGNTQGTHVDSEAQAQRGGKQAHPGERAGKSDSQRQWPQHMLLHGARHQDGEQRQHAW
jgi:hypothetical protein